MALALSLILLVSSFLFPAILSQQIPLSIKLASAPTAIDLGNDEDQIHVEYPTYIRKGTVEYLFYSKYGKKSFWQIAWATKRTDENVWEKKTGSPWGSKISGISNSAFPVVVQSKSKFYLFFSAKSIGSKSYDQLRVSVSLDLINWESPVTVFVAQEILSPEIILQGDGFNVYYSTKSQSESQIKKVELLQNLQIGMKPKVVFSTLTKNFGFYTINHFRYKEKDLWVVQSSRNWKLACVQKAGRIHTIRGPYLLKGASSTSGDRMFYGSEFVRLSREKFEIYFNSIRDLGVEYGGKIKKIEFSVSELNNYDLTKCA